MLVIPDTDLVPRLITDSSASSLNEWTVGDRGSGVMFASSNVGDSSCSRQVRSSDDERCSEENQVREKHIVSLCKRIERVSTTISNDLVAFLSYEGDDLHMRGP